MKSACEYY